MANIYDVVQLLESKKGNLYLKFTEDKEKLTSLLENFTPGAVIFLNNKQEDLDKALNEGRMDEDKHAYLSEKLSFIKYTGNFKMD